MEKDLAAKIGNLVSKQDRITEDEIRSLMVLIRKVLDRMTDGEKSQFLVLRLFCNWAAHNEITDSNTGLRILAKVNDALVDMKNSGDSTEMGLKMSEAISFTILRNELKHLFGHLGVDDALVSNNSIWAMVFLINLIEIIRDVPLAFPNLSSLDPTKLKIYESIAQNPIKPGAGVIGIRLTRIDFDAELGTKNMGEHLCLHIKTEETTSVVIPLTVDARL